MKWTAIGLTFLLGVALVHAKPDAHEDVLARADRTIEKVASLRGLKAKKAIKRGVMSKAQLEERIRARLGEQYTDDEIAGEALAMKRFGMLEYSADYLKIVTELLTAEIAGFYDPFAAELFLADWVTTGGEALLAHEIDHALQDQHFDLARFMTAEKKNADATAARQALVEGDGMAIMLEHVVNQMGRNAPWGEADFSEQAIAMISAESAEMTSAPFALREALVFPYVSGLRFIAYFRKHHGWERINKMFAKPPLSTEQILHPALYESYEAPIVVRAVLPTELRDYTVVYSNVAGEKGLATWLEAHGVNRERAVTAAAGWGGDAIAVFAQPNYGGKVSGTIGVIRSRWDDESDAIEFFEAVTHALPSLAVAGAPVAGDADGVRRYRDEQGAVASVERVGLDVVVLVGAPPAREPDLRAALFKWDAK